MVKYFSEIEWIIYINMKELITVLILFGSLLCGANENGSAIWNQERNAVAFCSSDGDSRCYVIYEENAINVSQVENANIGRRFGYPVKI